MPPKKTLKTGDGKVSMDPKNPRVILRPLRADSSGHSRICFTTLPPTAALFNKPELSDAKLKVGDDSYYAHRLVLCAGSEVFARMLGPNWVESQSSELELQEEEECVKVFDRFLYYFYTGSILITESYVIPLFMLADKYDVKALYDECVKVIENGLKVYAITKKSSSNTTAPKEPVAGTSYQEGGAVSMGFSSSSSSLSDSTDSETTESDGSRPPSKKTTYLAASETFPLALVMKMLSFCHNQRIASAALYNMEARLCKHILHANYGVWNDIDKDLLIQMLSDQFFYCNEFVLFKAAKSWLSYKPERQTEDLMTQVFSCIRYPILKANELYEVEKDTLLSKCPEGIKLVQEAIRYQLFRYCSRAVHKEKWVGAQFERRRVKEM